MRLFDKVKNYYSIIFKNKIEIWVITFSFLISSIICLIIFKHSNTWLYSFKERAIGIAIAQGIDPSLRTIIYYKLIFIFIFSFFINFFVLSLIYKLLERIKNNLIYRKITLIVEKKFFIISGIFLFLGIILYKFNNQKEYLYYSIIILYLILLVFIFMVMKIFFFFYNKELYIILNKSYRILFISMIFPLILIFIKWTLIYGEWSFYFSSYKYFFYHFIIWFVSFFIYITFLKINRFNSKTINRINGIVLMSFIPLFLIPAAIPIINESQFTLSGLFFISPRQLSIIVFSILFVVSIIILFYLINSEKQIFKQSRLIAYYYIPVIVISVVLYKYFGHYIGLGGLDSLHQGETITPTQQLFQFGKIPFVDIWPAHGLRDFILQTFYSFINGYRGLEMWMWGYIEIVLCVVFVYLVLSRFFPPIFSLFMALLFNNIIFINYATFVLLIAFMIYGLLKEKSLIRIILFYIFLMFIALWRAEFLAEVIPSFLIVVLLYKINNKDFNLTRVLTGFGIVFFPAIIVYFLLAAIRQHSFIDMMSLIIQFAKNDALVGGYISIIPDNPSKFEILKIILQYVIFPLVSLSLIIYLLLLKMYNKKISYKFYIIIFLSLFSLIAMQRGLARHSFIEVGLNYFLFVFSFMLIPFIFERFNSSIKMILGLIIFLGFFSISPYYSTFLPSSNFFKFRDWHNKESRVIGEMQYNKNILTFLNNNLNKNQTFYEFINAPALYTLVNKEVPNLFFLPEFFYATDPVQLDYIKRLKTYNIDNKIPYIIFKDNKWWGSAIDNIPSEVRSYRIAEYIYKNYVPFVNLDSYDIWIKKGLDRTIKGSSSTNIKLEFNSLPDLKTKKLSVIGNSKNNLVLRSYINNPQIFNFIKFNNIHIIITNNYYLKFNYRSNIKGNLQIFYNYNNRGFDESYTNIISLNPSKEFKTAIIKIPFEGLKNILTDIRFNPPDNTLLEIKNIELIERAGLDLIENNSYPQNFNLLKLPYVWGTYDIKKAAIKTKIIQQLNKSEFLLNPNEIVKLKIDNDFDKTNGNYLHLRIKSNSNSKCYISYGEDNISYVQFDIIGSGKFEDYLIRISSQYQWMNENIEAINLKSDSAIAIEKIFIRAGD